MGKRGPAATPKAILEARGSWRAKERDREPKPIDDKPMCPKWLDDVSKRSWRLLVPQLREMGVAGKCDKNALTRYVRLFTRWREAECAADVNTSLKLSGHLLRLEQQFGLTPAARAGLHAEKSNKGDKKKQGKGRFFSVVKAS